MLSSENLKKLKDRNIFEEIKKKVSPIRDTANQNYENEIDTENRSIADDILNDN